MTRLLASALLAAAVLVGCGDDAEQAATVSTTTTATPVSTAAKAAPTPTTPPRAAADALLTLDDMPAGWTVAPEILESDDEEPQGEQACTFDSDLEAEGGQSAGFKEGDFGPFVLHGVAILGDGADTFMADFQAFVNDCQSYIQDGAATEVSPLSFPAHGDDSFAFRIDVDDPDTFPVSGNVVIIREGDAVSLLVVLGVLNSPDAALTERLAGVAAERL